MFKIQIKSFDWPRPESYLSTHIKSMNSSTCLYKRPVKEIPVVRHEYMRLHVENMVEKSLEKTAFVWLVVHNERTLELRLWGVLKVVHVIANYISELFIIIGSGQTRKFQKKMDSDIFKSSY